MLYSGAMVRALLADEKTMTRRALRSAPPPNTSWMATYHHPKEPIKGPHFWAGVNQGDGKWELLDFATPCPYGQPGDRIWVRETSRAHELTDREAEEDVYRVMEVGGLETPPYGLDGVVYAADDAFRAIENTREASEAWMVMHSYRGKHGATVPGIHMPRWASRINLEVISVRVERLNEITEADAIAEGIKRYTGPLRWVRYLDAITGEPVHNTARDAFFALWVAINGQESLDANPWVWVIKFRRLP